MEKYKVLSAGILILFCSCISPGTFEEKYQLVSGSVIGKRLDTQDRLFLSLHTTGPNITGIVFNSFSPSIIKELNQRIEINHQIIIYGQKIDKVDEFIEGIDYRIYVVIYHDYELDKYLIIQTDYAEGLMEKFEKLSIRNIIPFLLDAAKKFI